jgi:hypothetical protein
MPNSALSNFIALQTFLEARQFRFIKQAKESHSMPHGIALFIDSDDIAARADSKHTSWRQLRRLQQDIRKKLEIDIEWIVIPGPEVAALETALIEILRSQFPGIFASAFVSSPKISPAWVWLEAIPGTRQMPDSKAVESCVRDLFKVFGFEAPNVVYANANELPSNITILRSIKINSPILVEDLLSIMMRKGSAIPDLRWLQTKLDTMRKSGLLVRAHSGHYALTELALATVPISKNRTSSDVERALALGRAKW